MEAIQDYRSPAEKQMSRTGKNKFSKNSKVNIFRSIIGVAGRRTGWRGPVGLKRDSSGLLDVMEFFSKDISPVSSPNHRQCHPDPRIPSPSQEASPPKRSFSCVSDRSRETIPVSPPLNVTSHEGGKPDPHITDQTSNTCEPAHALCESGSPVPLIDEKDLMLSKGISFYENLESSLTFPLNTTASNLHTQNIWHTNKNSNSARPKEPRSPTYSDAGFSLDSLIDEVRAPLEVNTSKRHARRTSDIASNISLYSNFKFIETLDPKPSIERFNVNFPQDSSSASLDDYSVKLSSSPSSMSLTSGSSVIAGSTGDANLYEFPGAQSSDSDIENLVHIDHNDMQENIDTQNPSGSPLPLVSKPAYKSCYVQASPMVLKKSALKEQQLPVYSPIQSHSAHLEQEDNPSPNPSVNRAVHLSPQNLSENGKNVANVNIEFAQPPLSPTVQPTSLNSNSNKNSMSPTSHATLPVNGRKVHGGYQKQDVGDPARFSPVRHRVSSPLASPKALDIPQSFSAEQCDLYSAAENNIEELPIIELNGLPCGVENLPSPKAPHSLSPAPIPPSQITRDTQMSKPKNVYKKSPNPSPKNGHLVPNGANNSSSNNINYTDPQVKVKRKRGRPRKFPLPQDTAKLPEPNPQNQVFEITSVINEPHLDQDDNRQEDAYLQISCGLQDKDRRDSSLTDNKNSESDGKAKRIRKRRRPSELPQFTFESSESNEKGVRRSRRMKIGRLRFWEGERVVLGRNDSGFYPVPVVKDVIRKDESEQVDDKKKKFKDQGQIRQNKTKRNPAVPKPVTVYNIVTGKEDKQHIVATPEMLNPRTVGTGDYKFQKVFSEGRFFASGMLVMPRGSEKPNKNSNRSAMTFFIVSGEVEVQIHKTKFVLRTGSQFFVPRGNQYRLVNVGTRECKLFFCHGKEVPVQELTM